MHKNPKKFKVKNEELEMIKNTENEYAKKTGRILKSIMCMVLRCLRFMQQQQKKKENLKGKEETVLNKEKIFFSIYIAPEKEKNK